MNKHTLILNLNKKNSILRNLKVAVKDQEINTVYYLRKELNELSPGIKKAISELSDSDLILLKFSLQGINHEYDSDEEDDNEEDDFDYEDYPS